MDHDKISLATDLIRLCLVPELTSDIDTQQIEAAHFKEFKRILDANLHLLFDLLQQHDNVLFEKTTETEALRSHFVILLCEQSADNVPYKTDQLMLQQNVTHLTGKWFREIVNEKCIFELVLQHYKKCIKVDVWKRNIGAVFGFHRFCQLNYSSENLLRTNEMFFVLATGTLLLEHYEPMYKQLGIDLCNTMMTYSNKSDILSANVHHAVYATCSPNIPKIQDHQINLKLWRCLYKCLEMDDSWKHPSDWHKVDELMMDLLKRIAFEGNVRRSTILFHFAAKFGALPHQQHFIVDELNRFSETDDLNGRTLITIDWHRLRNECKNIDSFIVYKWVKKMLQLIGNQNIFHGEDFEIVSNLQSIHLTYMVWCYSIPLTLISSPILDMLTKFIPTLLDCYRRYESNDLICNEIRQLFCTFLEQFSIAEVSTHMKDGKLTERLETLRLIEGFIKG